MKKVILMSLVAMAFVGCGKGNYCEGNRTLIINCTPFERGNFGSTFSRCYNQENGEYYILNPLNNPREEVKEQLCTAE